MDRIKEKKLCASIQPTCAITSLWYNLLTDFLKQKSIITNIESKTDDLPISYLWLKILMTVVALCVYNQLQLPVWVTVNTWGLARSLRILLPWPETAVSRWLTGAGRRVAYLSSALVVLFVFSLYTRMHCAMSSAAFVWLRLFNQTTFNPQVTPHWQWQWQ